MVIIHSFSLPVFGHTCSLRRVARRLKSQLERHQLVNETFRTLANKSLESNLLQYIQAACSYLGPAIPALLLAKAEPEHSLSRLNLALHTEYQLVECVSEMRQFARTCICAHMLSNPTHCHNFLGSCTHLQPARNVRGGQIPYIAKHALSWVSFSNLTMPNVIIHGDI
eukprot:1151275-Pelagomonas_calceolata.AAC.13